MKNSDKLRDMIDQMHSKVMGTTGQRGSVHFPFCDPCSSDDRNVITTSLYKELPKPEDTASAALFQPSIYKSWKYQDQSEATGGYFCEQSMPVSDFIKWMETGMSCPSPH